MGPQTGQSEQAGGGSAPRPAARWTQQSRPPQAASAEGGRGLAVWKQQLRPSLFEDHTLLLPQGAEFLSAVWEDGHAVVFFLVDPEAERVERRLLVVQTHREGLPRVRFVGTVRNEAGLALHLFEPV